MHLKDVPKNCKHSHVPCRRPCTCMTTTEIKPSQQIRLARERCPVTDMLPATTHTKRGKYLKKWKFSLAFNVISCINGFNGNFSLLKEGMCQLYMIISLSSIICSIFALNHNMLWTRRELVSWNNEKASEMSISVDTKEWTIKVVKA